MTLNRTPFVSLVLVSLCVATSFSCRRREPSSELDEAPASSALPKATTFELRATSDNLLLTWIDPQGDFHVVQKVADVPADARTTVRVVDLKRRDTSPDAVLVADLTQTNPDGTYTTKALPRREWDELGAARRKVRLEQMGLKPEAPAPNASAAGSVAPPASGAPGSNAAGIVAIIYGADWCKPCHEAEKHLKRTGILVIKKNIEEDPRARQEMEQKLTRAGRAGSSIPVIDVMGQILIGFSAGALDRAVETARRQQPAQQGAPQP